MTLDPSTAAVPGPIAANDAPRRASIGVCVLTYRRNRQLAATLAGLARLDRPDADVRIVVVDNNADARARPVVEQFRDSIARDDATWSVDYVSEPQRGIARARNRAVEACGDADFVAFVDDDELPEPDWLVSLCAVQAASRADVVVGRVEPAFDAPPPEWVQAGHYFERPRHATGQRMDWGITGNVLISRAVLDRYSPPFDERFNLSGGEDTYFFMRARDDGALIVSADDAVVFERIAPERIRWHWIMRREYRRGNTLSLCVRDLHPGLDRRVRRVGQGLLRIAQGLLLLLRAPFRRGFDLAPGIHRVCFGLGLLTGLFGYRYEQYVHELYT